MTVTDQIEALAAPEPAKKIKDSLTWFNSLDHDFDDVPSFRHMRAAAQSALDKHERIGKEVPAKIRKVEWDNVFAEENGRHSEAIRLIDGRLTALGINIRSVIAEQKTSPLYDNGKRQVQAPPADKRR